MAITPINPTQLTPPRVPLIDDRSGAISREWYRFFLSLLTATQTNQEDTDLAPDTASLLATYDAMLASATQASEIASDGMVTSLESSLNSLENAFGVTPPDLGGTVTSVAASGGLTGLTFTGSPITTSGTLTLGGTLGVGYGGTGQTSYTDGQLLIGNSTGNTLTKATLTAGTNVTITNGAGAITINATDQYAGTVTSVSVVSANGFAGTVATATTTPAITLSTSVSGLVKGNGTALSAAIAGTDYVAPGAITTSGLTMATARILGRTTASTGAVEEITVGTGLSLSAGTLSNSAPDQTVSLAGGTGISISGTYPSFTITNTAPDQIVSLTGAGTTVITGTYPSFTITSNDQYVGTVTSVSGTGTVNGITLTGTVTSTGSLTLGGTLSGVSLTSQVSGTLPIANGGTGSTSTTYCSLTTNVTGTLPVGNGGTGATTLTSSYLLKGNGTSAVTASVVYDDGTSIGVGAAPSAWGGGYKAVQVNTRGALASNNSTISAFGHNYYWDGSNNRYIANGTANALLIINNQFRWLSAVSGTAGNAFGFTERMRLQEDGKLLCAGVYNNTVGATNRDVFVDNTGLVGYVPSTLASKTNIADIADTSWLDALRPITFNYRKRDEDGIYTDEAETPLEYGLIAEEVEKINTELVFYDETEGGIELRGVSYRKLIIPLLKEVQSLRARVAALEGE